MDDKKIKEAFKRSWHYKAGCHPVENSNKYTIFCDGYEAALSESHKDIAELEKNQLPPLMKDCPECGGEGHIQLSANPEDGYFCSCNNGQIYNYLTPEQYVSWMRENGHPNYEMLDSDPVWVRMHTENGWKLARYKLDDGYHYMIVARLGQPAPPKDYKL